MNSIDSIILGIIQGLTEFLPVSSSGHLAMATFLGISGSEADLTFFIILHCGTLLALSIIIRKDIMDLLNKRKDLIIPLVITTSVTAVIAIPLKKLIEKSIESVIMVAIGFAVTTALILIGEFFHKAIKEKKNKISIVMSVIIGIFQGITPFAGVSRSGATISSGLFAGLDRETAVKYSFLLAIPAIGGALILDIGNIAACSSGFFPLLCGFLTAFASGYIALKVLFSIIKTNYYIFFALYTFLLSITMLLYGIFNGT